MRMSTAPRDAHVPGCDGRHTKRQYCNVPSDREEYGGSPAPLPYDPTETRDFETAPLDHDPGRPPSYSVVELDEPADEPAARDEGSTVTSDRQQDAEDEFSR